MIFVGFSIVINVILKVNRILINRRWESFWLYVLINGVLLNLISILIIKSVDIIFRFVKVVVDKERI